MIQKPWLLEKTMNKGVILAFLLVSGFFLMKKAAAMNMPQGSAGVDIAAPDSDSFFNFSDYFPDIENNIQNAFEQATGGDMKIPDQVKTTSSRGISFIKQAEGLSLEPYPDSAGYLTVGYGHKLNFDEPDRPISQSEADQYLAGDIAIAENVINTYVHVPLTQGQFDALVSFVFNLGGAAFTGSTLLSKLNSGDYSGAASEIIRWNKAHVNGQLTIVAGLTNRRDGETALFMS